MPPALARATFLLKELVPEVTRIGYVVNVSGADGNAATKADIAATALLARVTPVVVEYRVGTPDPAPIVQTFTRERVEGAVGPTAEMRALLLAARLPWGATSREGVAQDGLIGTYSVAGQAAADRSQLIVAAMMDKVLRGAKIADLKPERLPADEFTMAVNMATARTMGITIPASILDRAEKIG